LRIPGLGELNDLYRGVRSASVAALQQATAEADARLAAFVAPDGTLTRLHDARPEASASAAMGVLRPTQDLVQK
jgi:hypothetical protein